jgi:hypothetical protein
MNEPRKGVNRATPPRGMGSGRDDRIFFLTKSA